MSFVRFMGSGAGRATRIVAGLALIGAGIAIGGTLGVVLAVVGVVPLAAGVFNLCLFAPLFGLDLRGRRVRAGS
ncbi:MAG TPA: YgaP-like transmembrane domain [Solirubrobacteraceae bacterium]|nr:YgaP-like transmembrane domain [Solirubrobacteraceae bacterium]